MTIILNIWYSIKTLVFFSFIDILKLLAFRLTKKKVASSSDVDLLIMYDTFKSTLKKGWKIRVGVELVTIQAEELCFNLRRYSTDISIFNQIFYIEEYAFVKQHYDALFRTGGVVIVDAGANIGCSSVYFHQLFPNATIFSIEPDSSNFSMLENNIKYYDKGIIPFRRALWYEQTKLKLSTGFRDGREYAISVIPDLERTFDQVESLTLPDLKTQFNIEKIHILKVDIEGAEKYLFEEIEVAKVVMEGVELLALEIHDEIANRTLIEENLVKLGYECVTVRETTFAMALSGEKTAGYRIP